jgi:exopolyphosphatase/guanosine-5'-triphosphate,3'-diphosphate pyrophosphatase
MPEEIQIIAAVARFHKGALPKPSSEELAEISPRGREHAIKLAAILRVADALDRSHHGVVRTIERASKNGRVELRIRTSGGDAELELWAARRKSELWEKVFNSELVFGLSAKRESA